MGRIKGPAPCGVGPFTSDSVIVALHAHGGGAPAQGFDAGFVRTTLPLRPARPARTNPSRCTVRVIP